MLVKIIFRFRVNYRVSHVQIEKEEKVVGQTDFLDKVISDTVKRETLPESELPLLIKTI